jgi:hypothetical protein
MRIIFKHNLYSIIILLLLTAFILPAQSDSKKSIEAKLKEIKGNVNRIVIETGDGEVEFEGEEAEILFKRIKLKSSFRHLTGAGKLNDVFFFPDDSSDKHAKHKIIKIGKHDEMFFGDDSTGEIIIKLSGDDIPGAKMTINVEMEDGKKVVEVTTYKNGEKVIKKYEGQEAEEFLETHGGENIIEFEFGEDDCDSGFVYISKSNKVKFAGDKKLNWITADECDGNSEEVKVEFKDGNKVVTVTTSEDGESKTKIYEGDEAEEFLKNNNDNTFFISTGDDDSARIIKIKKLKNIDENEVLEWIDKDGENDTVITIKYTSEDDVKKLTIKSIVDGEEKTEVFEGEEAVEKLAELEKKHNIRFKSGGKSIIKHFKKR